MKKEKGIILTISIFILLVLAWYLYFSIERVEQSQPNHDKGNDWTAGHVGQVFIASRDAHLIGVKIKTQVKSYGKRQAGQRPLRINLVAVGEGNIPSNTILATGRTATANYTGDDCEWRTVFFDYPYVQTQGEILAIVMGPTEDVSPHAWHEIAFTESDSYPDGILWFVGMMGKGDFKAFNGDMAFQTIVTPKNPLKGWLNRYKYR